MLSTFSSVIPYLKLNLKGVIIDNFVFKLHYRVTFILLMVATILVTSRQYIGEHIKCITDFSSIPEKVINTYCFFTPTYTLVRRVNNSAIEQFNIFHRGIGPSQIADEHIRRHGYYQWVPFVLFGQALLFYGPHLIWKKFEGGRIKALVNGLRMVGLTKYLTNNSLKIGKLNLPSIEDADKRVKDIRRAMIDRMRLNQSWGAHLVFTEILNLMNLLLQIYLTNCFLSKHFLNLGPLVLRQKVSGQADILEDIFPKLTKCHFQKYGAGGSLQTHDALCVMALNIINEKIFTMLWFWYVFLFVITTLGLLWRLVTIFFYKNILFTKFCFYCAKPGKIDDSELEAVILKCNFSNWMFLLFLKSNLAEFLFKKVIYHLASKFPGPTRENEINAGLARDYQTNISAPIRSSSEQADIPLLNPPVYKKLK